jgi:hypothetical protein
VKRWALALALSACSGMPRSSMTDEQRVYLSKCTSCHAVYEPARYSPQEWTAIVAKMERLKKVQLSEAERAQILQYLTGDPRGYPVAATGK